MYKWPQVTTLQSSVAKTRNTYNLMSIEVYDERFQRNVMTLRNHRISHPDDFPGWENLKPTLGTIPNVQTTPTSK